MSQDTGINRRILIVDDNKAIHEDFRSILETDSKDNDALKEAETTIFGNSELSSPNSKSFELSSAFQGKQALEMVRQSLKENRPYAMAFMDIRMPPGWDGIETVQKIWAQYPNMQVVICTAYSDYQWNDIAKRLGPSEKLLILKKPFDNIEVYQMACALTEKWRLEKNAENKQNELMGLIEEKTLKLRNTNGELTKALDKAEFASKSKSEFLANMSHEIRTPMNSIIGFSDVLADSKMPSEQKQYVNLIREGANNLLGIINDILDFSKIEAGKLETNISDSSLNEILKNIEMLIGPSATNKGVDFKVNQHGDLPAIIKTDPTRVRQCLINLLGNAIKFTDTGHIHLNVSTKKTNGTSMIRFDIEDTGPGMNEEELSVIFDSFTQIESNSTSFKNSTGLGLTITKKLVTLLNGQVFVKSTKGLGSTFTLMIPANVDIDTQPKMDNYSTANKTNKKTTSDKEIARTCFSGKTLVAEDSKANQKLISILLKKLGFEVEIAENGKEALDKVEQIDFDIIFMDMQMPVMNGYQACEELRKRGIKIPIVALTANAMKGDREKCLNAGCDSYIAKPINRNKLLEIINTQMKSGGKEVDQQVDAVKSQVEELNKMCSIAAGSSDNSDGQVKIDLKSALRSCGDEKVVARIALSIIEDGPECLSQLNAAIENSRAKDILLYAHRLRGNALTIGAVEFAEKAEDVEECGRQEDVKKASSLMKELNAEFNKLVNFLSDPGWIEKVRT